VNCLRDFLFERFPNANSCAYNEKRAEGSCGKTKPSVPVAWEKSMNLNLPAEANEFVRGLIAKGTYQNEEEAVVAGIRLLMGREKLRTEIQVGIEQLDRGESCDDGTVFADVDAVIDEIEAFPQSK